MSTHPLHIHPDHQRALEAIAAEEHCSPEMLVHDVLENYIRAKQLQPRWEDYLTPQEHDEMTRDAKASWEDYRETGLHVTHDEVLEWFDRLRKDPHAVPPICHT